MVVALALALALALAGCSGGVKSSSGPSTSPAGPSQSAPTGSASADAGDPDEQVDPNDPAFDAGLSEPLEDSIYPHVGDPGIDTLHYDLALAWTPSTRTLDGVATIAFRATADATRVRFDLGPALDVSSVAIDGTEVKAKHRGKDLVVRAPVVADQRYLLRVGYSGTPEPVKAPTTRSDFDEIGFRISPTDAVWTMQEPYGAFTWYPVNDQPADKALYDFTLTVPSPWVGIANGALTDRSERAGLTTTQWHLSMPTASYLTTLAFGDYQVTSNSSASGLEIDYWVPRANAELAPDLEAAAGGLDWLEERLGPYPYDSLGFLLVDSRSGMETTTMITLGTTEYTTSPAVLVHELVHHWYGDLVTPNDWRDVWMNEGMAMYLQGMWEAEQEGITTGQKMDEWATFEADYRADSGPPADYDPTEFGTGNIYYGPALMWHELRQRLGDATFFAMIRDWPASQADGSSDREEYIAWIEDYTGEELSAFFDAWLLGPTTPPRG